MLNANPNRYAFRAPAAPRAGNGTGAVGGREELAFPRTAASSGRPKITVIDQELGTVTKLLKHVYGDKSPVD
jgi:hypothetical protein